MDNSNIVLKYLLIFSFFRYILTCVLFNGNCLVEADYLKKNE